MGTREALIARIRREYRENPGLQLTLPQACRLWDLDRATCTELLRSLLNEGFLRLTDDGVFVLPSLEERWKRRRERTS